MLYKIDPSSKAISTVNQADLSTLGFKETDDLESWVVKSNHIFDRHLIWIARQDRPTDSDRSDLVGIDEDAELLVVELKRGYVDTGVLTQALNYASEYASSTPEAIIALFVDHSARQTATPLPFQAHGQDEAERMIMDVTHAADINESQVIILVGTEFDPRVLSMCEYLNRASGSDSTLSVECWKIALFKDGTAMYLTLSQIVPTPDLKQQINQLKEERRVNKYRRDKNKVDFMLRFKEKARNDGYEISAKRGSSYTCTILNAGGLPIDLQIHAEPIVSFPTDGNYRHDLLDSSRLRQEGNIYVYTLRSLNWDDATQRESLITEILDTIRKMKK